MRKKIESALAERRHFLVAGDLMLDRYVRGDIRRISPEAPVPVLTVTERENKPGGAGNVALNLSGLNGAVTLLGFTGNDEAGHTLKELFDREQISLANTLWDRNTITKTRITSSRQQIVRVDDETDLPLTPVNKKSIMEKIGDMDFASIDGILISDYNKGSCFPELCEALIGEGKKRAIPVVVDPKGPAWEKYRGASLITPNVKELGDALGEDISNGDEEIGKAALKLLSRYEFERMVVTRSEKGMTLVERSGIRHISTKAREVFDVSGAGDTVAAALLRFLADGFPIDEAVAAANLAAGIVVGFLGTHPITKELLCGSLDEPARGHWETARSRGMKIVFTNGCFDLLHPGHMDYLKKARELGDYLVVGLNSDDSVRRLKGADRPINDQDCRKIMLESLTFVDEVILFEEDTPRDLIESIRPDYLVKGGDYRIDEIVGREFAGATLTIPFIEGYSSTGLMERIRKLRG